MLAKGMKLLQLDYLGGHGSRGSGRVSFTNFRLTGVACDADTASLTGLFEEVANYELFLFSLRFTVTCPLRIV